MQYTLDVCQGHLWQKKASTMFICHGCLQAIIFILCIRKAEKQALRIIKRLFKTALLGKKWDVINFFGIFVFKKQHQVNTSLNLLKESLRCHVVAMDVLAVKVTGRMSAFL